MTWPSPSLPLITSQTNATVQLDNHPADHATTNLVINDDVAPQITQNIADIATNAANIATNDTDIAANAADLTQHETRVPAFSAIQLHQPASAAQTSWAGNSGWSYQRRHGITYAVATTDLVGGTGGSGSNLETFVTLPGDPGDTSNIPTSSIVGYGYFDAASGSGFESVILLYDSVELKAQLFRQSDLGNGFDSVGVPGDATINLTVQYFNKLPDNT